MKYFQLTYLAARALRGCAAVEKLSSNAPGAFLVNSSATVRSFSSTIPESQTCKWKKPERNVLASSISKSVTSVANCSVTTRSFSSKVPESPTWKWEKSDREVPELDSEMIEHLERLSLVEFNNVEGVERLRSAIEYANLLHGVDTTGVTPMYSVLEERELVLREDLVTEGGRRRDVLQNAARTEEDYFVAPPGNIPLARRTKHGEET